MSRLLLYSSFQPVFRLDPVVITMTIPSPTFTLGAPPIFKTGTWTPIIVKAGTWVTTIEKTVNL